MFRGKTAIITGGTRGIGKAIAEEFAKRGADLLLTYRGNDEAAETTAEMLKNYHIRVLLRKGDGGLPEFARLVAGEAKSEFGRVDILVNNAGVTKDKLLLRMNADDFDEVIRVNLSGAFYITQAVASIMIKQKQGRIINISSIAGLRGNQGQVNYAASKAGLVGMTLSAAKELGSRGITVNAVAPGYIRTDMTEVLAEEQKEAILKTISLKREGRPEDVAKAVAFLSSDDAAYITGQVLGIDGGMAI
ncbi:MAG: 3-oxoacyl-[acyl-carrier-protein] reductase [Clostridiales Family XIII bacterium]|jgi:3-oxoacyl-[acyl-carrier protein] reductase|nr:3-oxoacyl-[acyl-carrier-protein] reductase [Clostridiales Family XIII bacterium]